MAGNEEMVSPAYSEVTMQGFDIKWLFQIR